MSDFRAAIGRGRLIMSQGAWRLSCPAEDLAKWLALYRRLRDRGGKPGEPGPWAKHYTGAVAALERLVSK